jgi:hypothetical protein
MKFLPYKYVVYIVVLIVAIVIVVLGTLLIKPVVYLPGCAKGDVFSSSTGKLCDPKGTKKIDGCANNNVFNALTGEKCPEVSTSSRNLFPFSNPSNS